MFLKRLKGQSKNKIEAEKFEIKGEMG